MKKLILISLLLVIAAILFSKSVGSPLYKNTIDTVGNLKGKLDINSFNVLQDKIIGLIKDLGAFIENTIKIS